MFVVVRASRGRISGDVIRDVAARGLPVCDLCWQERLRRARAINSPSLRDIPHRLMKTEVHYRVHKNLLLDSIRSQINQFQSLRMLWPVLCSTPEPFMRLLSFGFFDRTCVNLRIYHLLFTCYVSLSLPDLIVLIIFGTKRVNYDEFTIMVSTRLLLLACIYRDKWRHIHYYVYTEINDVWLKRYVID